MEQSTQPQPSGVTWEAVCFSESDAVSQLESRLDRIRRASNVVQALENLLAQIDGSTDHGELLDNTQQALIATQKKLKHYIHYE